MEKTLAFGEKNYNYYSAYLRNKYDGQKVYSRSLTKPTI